MTSPADGATAALARHYDARAATYDRAIALFERLFVGDGRAWACRQARGPTLEIAIGTGRNLGHYPPAVTLTGVELSTGMLARARERAGALGREVDLRQGDAQGLDLADATFDTVVCTLSLCAIPDAQAAANEMARVLRPGGQALLVEHGASPNPLVRGVERLLEPLMVRFEHDHLVRWAERHLVAAGLEVTHLERSRLGIMRRVLAAKPA